MKVYVTDGQRLLGPTPSNGAGVGITPGRSSSEWIYDTTTFPNTDNLSLYGLSSPIAVPESGSISLIGCTMLGLEAAYLRRRLRVAAENVQHQWDHGSGHARSGGAAAGLLVCRESG